MPTSEKSSMLDILVLKLLYLTCLWKFLISLFPLQLHSRVPKCCVAFLETLQISFLLCFSGFLCVFPTPTQLTYTLHWRETYLFSPWIVTFVYKKAHWCAAVNQRDIYAGFPPSAARSYRNFEHLFFLISQPIHLNSSGQHKSIWVLRTNCVEIPYNRDG